MKIGILGGGLTGLSLSYFLKGETEILEAENKCGGLCQSPVKNGFAYDIGGHIIFSKDAEVLKLMIKLLEKNIDKKMRKNFVLFKKHLVKYPFENDLSALPPKDNFECLYYYLFNNYPAPKNFEEWIYYTFGKGIAEKYMMPYNEKIWKIPPKKMGMEWVSRVPKPPAEDVIKSAIGIPTEGYTHQLYFYYPVQGGIQSLIRVLEKRATQSDASKMHQTTITNNFKIKKIIKKEGEWIVSDGKEEKKFDKLVSSIPVFELVDALDAPANVKKVAKKLKYNSFIAVLIGLHRDLSDKSAIYIPDKNIIFHRICFNNYFSKYMSPPKKSSLVAEITASPNDKIWNMSDKEIIQKVIDDLVNLGVIQKSDVCETDVTRRKYGYVIYDIDYEKNMEIINTWLDSLGIFRCGRFAEFKYLNMDACIRNALELSKKINQS